MEEEIPLITVKEVKDGKSPTTAKPLYKLKIEDLLKIPYDSDNECFIFRNRKIRLIMCGGTIKGISRDDTIFSFRIEDETGTIQCFYKFKEDLSSVLDMLNKPRVPQVLPRNITFQCSQTEITMFNRTGNDTVMDLYDEETDEMVKEVKTWFNDEIIVKQKIRDVGDVIHLSGQLLESESVRKISVIDFRIVENMEEHHDFLLERKYLYNHVY